MHCSQPERYIVSMLYLFSQLLVFETYFDNYFYDSHSDSYFFYFILPWNYNMNSNNMLEDPLLYARLTRRRFTVKKAKIF